MWRALTDGRCRPQTTIYARLVGDPRAVIERLTAAQNAHDREGMLDCFQPDDRSEQPLIPARTFQGLDQVRANWSALLGAIGWPQSCATTF